LVVALFLFGTVALAAKPASAYNGSQVGRICDVIEYPMTSWAGNNGYVSFDLYSGAGCSGSYLGTYYLMTPGNQYPGDNYFSENALLAHLRTLADYVVNGKQVFVAAASSPNYVVSGIYFEPY
jgi:hypothetical protein